MSAESAILPYLTQKSTHNGDAIMAGLFALPGGGMIKISERTPRDHDTKTYSFVPVVSGAPKGEPRHFFDVASVLNAAGIKRDGKSFEQLFDAISIRTVGAGPGARHVVAAARA